MSITTDSIDRASRINQIGYPEFTTKLITDTFNAIISANMTQQQAYIELVQQLSKDMTQYIEETRDEISGTDILNLLVSIAPDKASQSGTFVTSDSTKTLTSDQASKINTAVAISTTSLNMNIANTSSQIKDLYQPILQAIANRIAADKYTLLKDMVKLGLLRLVINNGEIQTSLSFEALDSVFYQGQSNNYNRTEYDFNSKVQPGSIVNFFVKYAASTRYSKVGVSTVDTKNTSSASNAVRITGSVKLNFSTDYQPLNTLTTI